MSDRPVSFLLEDLLDAIQRIQRYTDGQSLETFRENQMLQDAVIRNDPPRLKSQVEALL